MRFILDFQACQSASRYRGIGRGSRSLMLAMANRLMDRGHEVVCLLNQAFQDGADRLRADIVENASGVKFAFFRVPSPCAAAWHENAWRQMAARMLREHAIACLEPDFVHVPALLADGWGDDAVGSVGMLGVHVPTSLTQHDLIPLVMADIYMPPGPFHDYYMKKLEGVKRADLLLAISEYSRREAIDWLGVPDDKVVHISSAADSMFAQADGGPDEVARTVRKYGVRPGFLMYAPGGFDPRKNIDRLLEAYSLLPSDVRSSHQLVIASKLEEGVRTGIEGKARNLGLSANEIVLTDYVPDHELIHLYRACHAYVFPSLHEGFGLPALEAMLCGAPVIASNRTSIPEVIELDEALFDPYSPQSIAEKILEVVSDPIFRERLRAHAKLQPRKFSWDACAQLAVGAMEEKCCALKQVGWRRATRESLPSCEAMLAKLDELVPTIRPSANDLSIFRMCYADNLRAVCI